jgi:D-glycero-D-manno-heptose 1,7-bisphosphate phosphatase
MKPMKAVFLDRDGTLVKEYPDEVWATVTSLEIFPDTIEALRQVRDDFALFIITNQCLIQENVFPFEQFISSHKAFIALLEGAGIHIEQTYYCPHPRDMDCKCRKPAIGMIEQCQVNYEVDLVQSYVVGDSEGDIRLAAAIGATSIAVREYHGTAKPDFYASDMASAVEFIRKRETMRAEESTMNRRPDR